MGNYNAVGKAGLDLTMSYIATFGGVPGLVIGSSYFVLDSVGGFDSAPISSYYNYYPSAAPADNTRVNINCP